MIDIVTTATLRPKLLDLTYHSFTKKLFKNSNDYRLILNVDPIGENVKPKEVIDVAKKYFKNITTRVPKEPSFARAVIWGWQNTTSDFVFHLEDDWECLVDIDINRMINIMTRNSDIASLRLNKFRFRTRSKAYILHDRISLNPSLINGIFVRSVFVNMSRKSNPEKQLRVNNPRLSKIIKEWKYGVYSELGGMQYVKDIGRDWMNRSRYSKKTGFTEWKIK